MTSTLRIPDHVTVYGEKIWLPQTTTKANAIKLASAIESFVVNQECRNFRHFVLKLEEFDAGLIWKPAREPGQPDTHRLWIEPGGELDRSLHTVFQG